MAHSDSDLVDAFFRASVWYGPVEEAEALLRGRPELAGRDIFAAALVGNANLVKQFVTDDKESAVRKGGPLGWDPLTYLSFSKFLRTQRERSSEFVESARILLEAGADANTGFYNKEHTPQPCLESAIYGAAGVAFHPELTQLLLEFGAEPNDDETPYHSPESYDNAALRILVESGRLTEDSLATMLLRKCDIHDAAGIRYLLQNHADPNRMTLWGYTALHQSIRRDNALSIVDLLLQHGADPTVTDRSQQRNSIALAAGRGRGDILTLIRSQGCDFELSGLDSLLAACALDDAEAFESIRSNQPSSVDELLRDPGKIIAEFAGNGNCAGIERLLTLGVSVDTTFTDGDGYWGLASDSTPLHFAAWRARHESVIQLIRHGANVQRRDGKGRSPLMLAVKACVDSYWTELRKPDSVAALLNAGASADEISLPTGYEDIDRLLEVSTG